MQHTYSQNGNWTITIVLNSNVLGPISATGTATSSHLPQVYKVNAHNRSAGVGKQFCGTVAIVTGTISKKGLSITIDWGDGTTSKVTLRHGKGTFQVRTCHTYTYAAGYPIVIDALDNGTGETATALGTATVA
jgi:hypothetical protein